MGNETSLGSKEIPLSKVMWAVAPQDITTNMGHQVQNEHIEIINKIIASSFHNFKDNFGQELTDIEKVVAVDSFLQKNIQYIGCNETAIGSLKYRKEGGQPTEHHKTIIGALETNRGVCDNYAYLMTLFLNNPIAKVDCHYTFGESHSWNNIVIDNKIYSHDTTQNVTAGKNRFKDTLQSSDYNYGATLTTPNGLDLGGDPIVMYRAGREPMQCNWWKGAKYQAEGIQKQDKRGILDDYNALRSKYEHADERIAPAQIEAAIKALKEKGLDNLFEYPPKPYYRQIAEPLKKDIILDK